MGERLRNGNLVVGAGPAVYEYDMLGNQIERWAVGPEYSQHHDVIEKPDGNLLVAVDKLGLETIEDHIIELDRNSGEVVREWDLREVMDVHRTAFHDDPRDWLHVNAIWSSVRSGHSEESVAARTSLRSSATWTSFPRRATD